MPGDACEHGLVRTGPGYNWMDKLYGRNTLQTCGRDSKGLLEICGTILFFLEQVARTQNGAKIQTQHPIPIDRKALSTLLQKSKMRCIFSEPQEMNCN